MERTMADASRLKRRLSELTALRQPHEQVWRDCFDWSYPQRGSGFLSEVINANDAQSRKAKILDSTATDSIKIAAATLVNGTVPANQRWFALDVGNESDEERRWLDDTAQFIWENIHNSNFDAEVFDGMIDLNVAGWSILYCEEAPGGGYHFESWSVGQCKVGTSRTGGRIDTIYREFELSVSQVIATYGLDAVSQKVRDYQAAGKLDQKIKLVHAIEPRELYAVEAKLSKNMPFASCHMELEGDHLLRESGYHEFPCMVPRWMRLPNSPYATGPMSDALPDVRTLNEVVKWDLMGAETTLAPPLIAEDDGVLNAKNIKLGPRKVIVANSVDSIKPLISGVNVQYAQLTIDRLQSAVRKTLMADQLPPADGPVKTAYEWSVRVETLRKILGPVFGRMQAEFLQPLVERCFGIMWRANEAAGYALVGKPPASLAGRNFTVRYLSPLAKAQRMEDVESMDRFELSLTNAAAATGDTSLLDVYDFEEAERSRGQLLGVPQKLVRDAKSVAKVREQRAKAQAAQQQAAVDTQIGLEAGGAMAKRMATGT
jgi:hypothetical protein